jgi:phospholipid/cholesterol/gamma-HCH transport system substrate-binding protein
MSISRAQRVRLGVFLVIGLALLVVFVAIPMGLRIKDTTHAYIAFFSGESLSGLEQGATVKFSGVPIGKVDKISYLPDDLERVRVEIRIQGDFPLKEDMVATTGAMGITGLKYIEITGGTNKSKALKPGSEIATKVSRFSTISGKAEDIVAKIELLLNHLNMISNPDSLLAIKEVLDNVVIITEEVRKFVGTTRPEISQITGSTNTLIVHLDSIAQDVHRITSNVDQSISRDRLGNTFSKIDSAAYALKNVAEDVSLLVRQSREDFTMTMENIKNASENADQLILMLRENPSLLLRSGTQKERAF